MKRAELKKLTQEFLKTYGYIAKPIEDNAILFSRPTGLGAADDYLIYFHEIGEERIIKSTLTDMVKKYDKIPSRQEGRRFFLSPLPLGRVPEGVNENGFKYQVPVWFFDREFSSEKRLTPLKQLAEEAVQYEKIRIEQPFKTAISGSSADLFTHLLNDLEHAPKQACIRIILAPAGYGKTVLMGSLYERLLKNFLKNKQEQQFGMRPLLMLPGHIKQATDVESLINNFVGDEYDYGVSNKNSFNFWIKNNFVVWLLDGLEELILKIPEEFIYSLLNEYIYTSDNAPQIIIAIRKSVLATSPELKATIDEWEGNGLTVYELCEWEIEQKKHYFRKNLKLTQNEIETFTKELSSSSSLQKICSVPYYCSLISELRNSGQMKVFNDDCELVDHAVKKLCEREFTKGIDRDILPIDSQLEIFSELALESFKTNIISIDTLKDLAELFLDKTSKDIKINQTECLLRHALLTRLGEEIDFMHDIIKQYLLGVGLSKEIINNKVELLDGREIEIDSFAFRYILRNSNAANWRELIQKSYALASSSYDEAFGFRNTMKIFLLSGTSGRESLITDKLHSRNLTGVIFKDMNLANFEFQGSKLDNVKFLNCNLSGASFNGCNFNNTIFLRNCKLIGVTTKGAILESIGDGDKMIYDKKDIEEYLYEKTNIPTEVKEPCQAVINLRRVIEKLTRNGKGWKIPKGFIMQVKCRGGIPCERYVDVAIKYGVISEIGDHVKIRIDIFEEAESFVKDPTKAFVGNKIKEVLDEVCADTKLGCRHIYKA